MIIQMQGILIGNSTYWIAPIVNLPTYFLLLERGERELSYTSVPIIHLT